MTTLDSVLMDLDDTRLKGIHEITPTKETDAYWRMLYFEFFHTTTNYKVTREEYHEYRIQLAKRSLTLGRKEAHHG